jgi:hypothetical protein
MHLLSLITPDVVARFKSKAQTVSPLKQSGRALLAGFGVLLLPGVLLAQDNQYTKNTPDQTMRSDARVDPASHALSIQIPLAAYPGRAGLTLPISITYSSKFRHLEWDGEWDPPHGGSYYLYLPMENDHSVAGWTNSLAPPRIEGDVGGYDGYFGINVGQPGGTWPYIQFISRIRRRWEQHCGAKFYQLRRSGFSVASVRQPDWLD